MKRRFFIVRIVGSLAVAALAGPPTLARATFDPAAVSVRRAVWGAIPGGCSTRRRTAGRFPRRVITRD